jgi:hypothetical protein
MDDILFAKVHVPYINKEICTHEIMEIDKSYWFWDPYRATNMLPLMTKNSVSGPFGTKNDQQGEFQWLHYTPGIIIDWFETHIFPWMGTKTRIMALQTDKKSKNLEHVDCDENSMFTRQHKFRIVLKGKTETLYFKTELGDVYVPTISTPFLMDGGWPHGMNNIDNDYKLTLAAGAPWVGNNSYDNIEILMKKSEFIFPKNFQTYFKKPLRTQMINHLKT